MVIIHDPFHRQKSIQIQLILTKHLHTCEVFIQFGSSRQRGAVVRRVVFMTTMIVRLMVQP